MIRHVLLALILVASGVSATLTRVSPSQVAVGTFQITISGSGFSPSTVAWADNQPLRTTFVSDTALTASGTALASGLMLVRVQDSNGFTPAGILMRAVDVLHPLVITPSSVALSTQGSQQFSVTYRGVASQALSWTASSGTISPAGLYSPPSSPPLSNSVLITATGPNNSVAAALITVVDSTPQISAVTPQPLETGFFRTTITGSGFCPASRVNMGTISTVTQYVSSTTLVVSGFTRINGTAFITVSNGPLQSLPYIVQIGPANARVSAAAARRFLRQAAFGPSQADADAVQTLGFDGWLDQQMTDPSTPAYQGLKNRIAHRFFQNAAMRPDQLRQRVAFALSQIFVVAMNKTGYDNLMAIYQQMLLNDTFGTFRALLEDVTFSPVMAQYLDMANNGKANASGTVLPNENFARELMQLFSIGPDRLNPDGTPVLDAAGNAAATYDQRSVAELARVFTGWMYPGGYWGSQWVAQIDAAQPMAPYPAQHDFGAKTLFWGTPQESTIPASLSPHQDVEAALDIIAAHPNVAPFIGKQLIQHLVKSNPTPAYVQRVSNVFNDNGQGVRGDLRAVIKAILLDPEARANDTPGQVNALDGHLQEPALYFVALLRGLGATVGENNWWPAYTADMEQDVFNSTTVFNYYSPNYTINGSVVTGGEFQIYDGYSSIYRANVVRGVLAITSNTMMGCGPACTLDIQPLVALAGDPDTLVDALDFTLTAGTMPAPVKQIIADAVRKNAGLGALYQAETGIYLTALSSAYNIVQ